MRTIQKTYHLYMIEELEDKAQEKAYSDWQCNPHEYVWASDNCKTLTAFCDLFHVRCTNYSYDSCTYNYSFLTDWSGEIENLSGIRLATYLYNNFYSFIFQSKTYWTKNSKKKRKSHIFVHSSCPLTGFIMDDILLQPIYEFLQHPDSRTFEKLIDDCLNTFFMSCRDDCDFCSSEDYFKEESANNNWEYLADGTLFNSAA